MHRPIRTREGSRSARSLRWLRLAASRLALGVILAIPLGMPGIATAGSAEEPPVCCSLVLELEGELEAKREGESEGELDPHVVKSGGESGSSSERAARLGAVLSARLEAALESEPGAFDSDESASMTLRGESVSFVFRGVECGLARRFVERELLAGDALGLRLGDALLDFDSRTVSEAGPGPGGDRLQLVLYPGAAKWFAETTREFEGGEAQVLVDGKRSGGRISIVGEVGSGWISLRASEIGRIDPSHFRLPIVGRLGATQYECEAPPSPGSQ